MKMFQDIRSAYYGLSGAELFSLARDEGIDYFVFELKYANLLQLKPVYQNAHFAICEPILRGNRVLAENAFLLVAGLVTGTACALVAVAPAAREHGGQLPWLAVGALLGLVLVTGAAASLVATAAALRSPVLEALKSE